MLEKLRIKEHMEVVDSNGQHVGTVDEVHENKIRLTRSDSTDDMHHILKLDEVDKIADNRVYLRAGAAIPSGTGATR